jgi:tetratricopeptide (TPR) repeat protein
MRRRHALIGLLIALAAADARRAPAQPNGRAASDEARRHRQAGYDAYDMGDYDTAIGEFEQAYRLENDPRLLYNLGLAYRKRHQVSGDRRDLLRARDGFRHFLAMARPDDPRFAADRQWLDKARTLAAQYAEEIDRTLSAAPARRHRPSRPPAIVHPRRPRRVLAGTLLVVGAVAAVGSATTGVLAWRDSARADDLASDGDHVGANDAGDRASSLALASDIMLGAGALAAGIGLYLWLRHPSEEPVVTATPGGIAVQGRF